MTKNKFLTIWMFACALLCACSTAPETHTGCKETYLFRNKIPCETFKQEHLSASGLDVTFTKKPKVPVGNSFWVVTWNGIDVLLPRAPYEHVVFFTDSDGGYNFRLSVGSHLQISLLSNRNDRYEDVFAVSNWHDRTTETTAEGIAATRAMFGGPIRYSELMMRAYETTPQDVTCCLDRYTEEMGLVVALIMKRIDRPDRVVAAYKGIGRHTGWMTASKSDGRVEYALNIVPEKDAKTVYHITYEMSAKAPYHDVPFLIGRVDSSAAAPSPGWVAALNWALQEDASEAWHKYIDAAREAGLSPKSIQIVEEMLQTSEIK